MKILVIAPHRDDEILGCGGTIAKYIDEGHQVYLCFATYGQEPLFSKESSEQTIEEAKKCHEYLGITKVFALPFGAAMLDSLEKYKLNDALAKVVREVQPDIVYIPHYGDMHTDHQIVADAAMVVLRPIQKFKIKEIYAYETLSETEWNYPEGHIAFIPNTYVNIDKYMEIKIEAMRFFKSQLREFPHSRSIEAIEALAKYRGSQMSMKNAESFKLLRKLD